MTKHTNQNHQGAAAVLSKKQGDHCQRPIPSYLEVSPVLTFCVVWLGAKPPHFSRRVASRFGMAVICRKRHGGGEAGLPGDSHPGERQL